MSGHVPKDKKRYSNVMLDWRFSRLEAAAATTGYTLVGIADRDLYIDDVILQWIDQGTQAGTFQLVIVRAGTAPAAADVEVMDSAFNVGTPTGAAATLISLSKSKPTSDGVAVDTLKSEIANRKLGIGDQLWLKMTALDAVDVTGVVSLSPMVLH